MLDVDGKRATGKAVDVDRLSRTWKSVQKKDATGGFTTVSEPVETRWRSAPRSRAATARCSCKFKPAAAGFYIVRAQVKDETGPQAPAAPSASTPPGSDFVAWQRNDTDRIELVLDKPKYDVGDVAKVLVKSPYPEANALLTVEREGVLQRRLVHLKGSVVAVEVPITEAMVPNVYARRAAHAPARGKGGIETGDDPNRPNARVGLVKLERGAQKTQAADGGAEDREGRVPARATR